MMIENMTIADLMRILGRPNPTDLHRDVPGEVRFAPFDFGSIGPTLIADIDVEMACDARFCGLYFPARLHDALRIRDVRIGSQSIVLNDAPILARDIVDLMLPYGHAMTPGKRVTLNVENVSDSPILIAGAILGRVETYRREDEAMPVYEYSCKLCGHFTERRVSLGERDEQRCDAPKVGAPERTCGADLARVEISVTTKCAENWARWQK